MFHHGVASFDPTQHAVVLWTRAVGATEVAWWIERDDGSGRQEGTATTGPEHDWCVGVVVGDLAPGASHRYGFAVGAARSPTGRTRTLPAGEVARWRFVAVSCADPSIDELHVYRLVSALDVDAVVHLGDYIYEEAKGRRPVAPDHPCRTVDDYRARYASTRLDPHLQALHRRHPMIAVWDDHDLADNAWRGGAKEHDPDEHGPWDQRWRAAARAWHEWLPCQRPDPTDPRRIWRSRSVGDLAELVLADTRLWGRDLQVGDPGALPLGHPDRTILGVDQRAWVVDRITSTSHRWCLLATQVVLNPLVIPLPEGATVTDAAPSGYAVIDGAACCTDEWDGYPREREAVARAIARRGGPTLVLSGDVHSSWLLEGPPGPGGRPAAVELVAPGVSSTPLGHQLPRGWRRAAAAVAERVPTQRWFDLEHWGALVVDLTPGAATATWYGVHPDDRERRAVVLAAWQVPADDPGRAVRLLPAADPRGGGSDGGASGAGPADQRPGRRRRTTRAGALVAGVLGAGGLVVAGVLGRRRRR